MKFKAELVDLYLSLSKQNLSIRAMSKIIKENHKHIELSERTINSYLGKIKREQEKVFSDDTNREDWVAVEGNYLFDYKGSRKIFSIALIDQIFLYYVRRGYNFTRSAVQQRFNLTPANFAAIQSKFNLSKESDLFSPYTKKNTSREELEDLTDALMQEIINSGEMTTMKHQKALQTKYQKVISSDNRDKIWQNTIISEVLAEYATSEKPVIKVNTKTHSPYYEMDWNFTDIHGGSKAEKMKITADWSMAKLEQTLDRATQVINGYGCARNHINFLGDLVETISGVNHPDSWKLVENGHFGAKAIIEVKELLVRFLNKINNLTSINGVGGNHDRLQASNKNADTGATDLIFYMLEQEYKNTTVEVNYDSVLLALDRRDYGVILMHGDKGLHKRSLEFLILNFAINPRRFQFINSGHLHTLAITDSQHIGRKTVNPSIITGNPYSDVEIGKADRSGISFNTTNIFNEPVQGIENL